MDTLVRSGTAEPLGIKLGLSFPEEDCTGYGFKNIRSKRAMCEVVLAIGISVPKRVALMALLSPFLLQDRV